MKKQKIILPPRLYLFLQKRSTIAVLLLFICLIGLPLRMQNVKLEGYISDDAWWHFRHVRDAYQLGHRMNPDPYEFTTLNRPMTYTPLFHYLVGYSYRLFDKFFSLFRFTHYFNLLEAIAYILLVYGLSLVITRDPLFSLIGALAASTSYGFIIRARAGELMPFVPGDLFAFASILILLVFAKYLTYKAAILGQQQNDSFRGIIDRKCLLFSLTSGIFLGLSLLSWSGGALIYLPLAVFVFVALIIVNRKLSRPILALFSVYFLSFLFVCLPWYLPLISKYGINPHSKEMAWFMQNFTVLRQVKPLIFYIFTSGISIFFIPVALVISLTRKDALNIFFIFWVVLAAIATYSGWRGYVAVVPILAAVAISIAASGAVQFFWKEKYHYATAVFIILFLLLGVLGYRISAARLAPLDPKNANEVRTNEKSLKMLEFLKNKYPDAVTVDHITWMSEDEALGSTKMIGGQYLEYLPAGASEALKDISRIYLSDEEQAYKICQKYNVELIIVRRQFFQLPQLSIIFAPPELKSQEYLTVAKDDPRSAEITISFTPKGTQSMLFRMISRQKLNNFELVYVDADQENKSPIPALVVYKTLETPPQN